MEYRRLNKKNLFRIVKFPDAAGTLDKMSGAKGRDFFLVILIWYLDITKFKWLH